ncbi:MAG: hypothetical protein AAF772_17745, partial [Acidobacteriota bacterium]
MEYSSFCVSPELPPPTKAERRTARRRVREAIALHPPASLLERETLYNLPAALRFLDWCYEELRVMSSSSMLPWAIQAPRYIDRILALGDWPLRATAGMKLYSLIVSIVACGWLHQEEKTQAMIKEGVSLVRTHRNSIHWRLQAYFFRTVAVHAAVRLHDRMASEKALRMAEEIIRAHDNSCEEGCCLYVRAVLETYCANPGETPKRSGRMILAQLPVAIDLFGQSIEAIDESQKPELYASAVANMSICLAMSPGVDNLRTALGHLDKARKKIATRQRSLSLATVKLDWLHGLILARLHCYGPSYRKLRRHVEPPPRCSYRLTTGMNV